MKCELLLMAATLSESLLAVLLSPLLFFGFQHITSLYLKFLFCCFLSTRLVLTFYLLLLFIILLFIFIYLSLSHSYLFLCQLKGQICKM